VRETRGRGKSCEESGVPEWYERTGGEAGLGCRGKAKKKAYAENTEDAKFAEKSREERRRAEKRGGDKTG